MSVHLLTRLDKNDILRQGEMRYGRGSGQGVHYTSGLDATYCTSWKWHDVSLRCTQGTQESAVAIYLHREENTDVDARTHSGTSRKLLRHRASPAKVVRDAPVECSHPACSILPDRPIRQEDCKQGGGGGTRMKTSPMQINPDILVFLGSEAAA